VKKKVSIIQVLEKLERLVQKGKASFHLIKVPTVCGQPELYPDWIESTSPVEGLAPLEFLAELRKVPELPPHGLSWDDYHLVTEASLDEKSSVWREPLLRAVGLSSARV